MSDSSSTAIEQIPIIDISAFRDGSDKQGVARAVQQAAESVGFLYIAGHGVDQALIDRAFAAAQAFFALPEADKMAVKVNASHRGYMPFNNSTYTADLKPNFNETFLAGLDLGPDDPDVQAGVPLHGPNQWPPAMPALRTEIEAYYDALMGVGETMLRIFAMALDLEEEYFLPYFKKPMPFVRLLHYPPQPPTRAENEFGIAPHTDYGFVTILAQDEVGGLQVRKRGGGWIDAPYIPGTFVVNIADMLKRWTNDRWASTPHRVINTTGRERYSIPFFFDPTYHTLVECIPGCNRDGEAPKYQPITWGDYLKQRFDSTYDYRKKRQAGA